MFCGLRLIAGEDAINADIVNSRVQRTVDLTTHLPKVNSRITVENTGKMAVRFYIVAIDPNLASNISFVGALTKTNDEVEQRLTVKETTVSGHRDKTFYRVDLPSGLDAGKEITLDVETSYSHSMHPYPTHITQSERQYVRFIGNVYFYTPYHTQTLSTVVLCATSSIESYTKEKPVSTSEKTITYGPYEDVEPFKETQLSVHFENNVPFLTVTQMARLIEVSHWGNIAIEETYDLAHSGAVLKGPFSRYDYQRHQDGVSSVKSFKTVLPPSAKDVYYRDEIGNISTSHMHETDDGVELELKPRFPLFGGWKTNYYIGYNIPSYQYLYHSGDKYALVMKFVDHVFDDQVIDHMTLKIILPEGSTDIHLKTPYSATREKDSLHYTYLDTLGRPVITLRKDNLVEQHILDFELRYTFPKYMLLQEPLLIVSALYLLFLVVIVYVRMDFAISKDEASESRMRVASLVEQAQAAHDRRSALYQSYEDAVNKYKSTKDLTLFGTNRKKIDGDHKTLSQQIGNIQSKLKAEGSDASDKVAELQKLDTSVREQITLSIQLAEKLVNGRISKQQYIDGDAGIRAKRDELCQKMDVILASL